MPTKHDTFTLVRSFTPKQMKTLRKGNIPQAMEDKWFRYNDDSELNLRLRLMRSQIAAGC